MRLRHLHLPGLTPYTRASQIQDTLVSNFLAHKSHPATIAAPGPIVLTAQFNPVYTCGRREIGTVTPDQASYLRSTGAEFHEALRGGQTTFHGPGQLIAYPILDLRRHSLSPRSYVCLLEKSVIAVCAKYGIKTMTTQHPGVWVSEDEKIAALGVHLRRFISSHGVGVNVATDLSWFGRIVACGLEGKRTTSFVDQGVRGVSVEDVGTTFVEELAGRLEGVDGVELVDESSLVADERMR